MIISGIAIAALALPIVILGPRPGLEIVQPLAVVLLGGVVSSLIVALFLLPSASPAPDSASSGGGTAGARGRAATGRRGHRGVIIMSTKSRLRTVRHSVLGLVLGSRRRVLLGRLRRDRVGSRRAVRAGSAGIDRPVSAPEDHSHRRGNAPSCAPDNGRRRSRVPSSRFITVPWSMTRRVCRGSSQSLGPGPTSVRRSPSNMSMVTSSR